MIEAHRSFVPVWVERMFMRWVLEMLLFVVIIYIVVVVVAGKKERLK